MLGKDVEESAKRNITRPEKIIVAKFGGTSMGSADAMRRCAQIISKNSLIGLVVVSATSGTTQLLLQLYNQASEGQNLEYKETIKVIVEKHRQIAADIGAGAALLANLDGVYEQLRQVAEVVFERSQDQHPSILLDQLLSIGEQLSASLFCGVLCRSGLNALEFDARKVMRTDRHFGKAEPQLGELKRLSELHLLPHLISADRAVLVTQGFIGATELGETTTLGRGTGDYSATLLAESIGAQQVQIWTDVPGIFTMDPSVVPEARAIPRLSFSEAAELANFGAKVLHPVTLWPAIRNKIGLFVGSTFFPDAPGTWIRADSETLYSDLRQASNSMPQVRAIALRKSQTLITVTSPKMVNAHGFLAKLFTLLARHKISVDLVTTSEVSVSLTIDGSNLNSSGRSITENKEIFEELKTFSDVVVEEGLTLVAIIGNQLNQTKGVSAKAFGAIADYSIRLICHGASHHNLCFLVNEEESHEIVRRLHQEFIEKSEVLPQIAVPSEVAVLSMHPAQSEDNLESSRLRSPATPILQ